jgi:hypothetical protein|tara:strand:+ start:875 stop:1291 length:417 start_codon:yes stop_codon:yes gene_type:complete
MPLDKIIDTEKYVQTHKSLILHIKNNPVGCIIEENDENENKYLKIGKKSEVKGSITGFLNKHDDDGLLMGFKFKIQINNEILEYTSYPNDEFIDAIILNEMIFIINNKMKQIFSCKILTDQFVKTKSEFNKFQKILEK